MVMKRSTRQISILHVYHHSSISLIWWAIAHHAPGGEGKLIASYATTLLGLDTLQKLSQFLCYITR